MVTASQAPAPALEWAVVRAVRHTADGRSHWARLPVLCLLAAMLVASSTFVLSVKRPGWNGWLFENIATHGYLPEGQHAQALGLFVHMKTHPKMATPDAGLLHAQTLRAMDMHPEARNVLWQSLGSYRQQAEADPSPENLRRWARCCQELGEEAQALTLYQQAIEKDDDKWVAAVTDDERAAVLWSKAQTLLWSQGAAQARAMVDEALALEVSAKLEHSLMRWRDGAAGQVSAVEDF